MNADIRDNLMDLIKDRCCVQASIARKANMTPDKLSLILNKKRKLEANELFNLCEVLDVTPVELQNYCSKQMRRR